MADLAVKPVSKVIDGHNVKCTTWYGEKSFLIYYELVGVLGDSLGELIEGLQPILMKGFALGAKKFAARKKNDGPAAVDDEAATSLLLDTEIDLSVLGKAVTILYRNCGPQDAVVLVQKILDGVTVDDKPLDFDKHFANGQIGFMIKILGFVLGENADFFQGIRNTFSSAIERMQPPAGETSRA